MTSTESVKHGRQRYVLVIEDNVHHAELITEILDRHFAPVVIHTVDTIEDALEFASQANYDMIITAGVVRDTSITEYIPKLSRLAEHPPIIVISGKGDEKLATEYIKNGATEYLGKTRETLEILASVLERHFAKKHRKAPKIRKQKSSKSKTDSPTTSQLLKEVDRLTQEALIVAGTKRKKSGSYPQDIEQLDRLLGQIQRLRELATKLMPKDGK